jgi:hypothetical protein
MAMNIFKKIIKSLIFPLAERIGWFIIMAVLNQLRGAVSYDSLK